MATKLLLAYPLLKENPKKNKTNRGKNASKLLALESNVHGATTTTTKERGATKEVAAAAAGERTGHMTDLELDIDPQTGALRRKNPKMSSMAPSISSIATATAVVAAAAAAGAPGTSISSNAAAVATPPGAAIAKKKKKTIKRQRTTQPIVLQVSSLNFVNRLHFSMAGDAAATASGATGSGSTDLSKFNAAIV